LSGSNPASNMNDLDTGGFLVDSTYMFINGKYHLQWKNSSAKINFLIVFEDAVNTDREKVGCRSK
jgi:hypothetical protein